MEHSIFNLYAVLVDDYYFVCRYNEFNKTYQEILTKQRMPKEKIESVSPLRDYHSILAIYNFKTKQPLMLNKKDILNETIMLNQKKK